MMHNRFLIFIVGGIGDVLMATPMIRAIKTNNPSSFVAVYTNTIGAYNFLNAYGKNIDLIICEQNFVGNRIIKNVKIINEIRNYSFNFLLFSSTLVTRKYYLIAFLSGIKKRIGFVKKGAKKYERFFYKIFSYLLTDSISFHLFKDRRALKNLEILKLLGIHNDDTTYYIREIRKQKEQRYINVGIHPGSDANGIIKRWDVGNFSNLIKLIINKYNFNIKIFLGPDETELEQYFDSDRNIEIIRNKKLNEVVRLINNCEFFISNDSGLGHIAAALKKKVVTLYGPTLPNEYVLPTKNLIVEKEFECRPCFHKKIECPFSYRCLNEITVDEVMKSFENLFFDRKK